MARYAEEKMSGVQKAAILLIALGPERSSNIFKHLKEEEIEELTLEIANTRSVTPQIKEEVIDEFLKKPCCLPRTRLLFWEALDCHPKQVETSVR